LEVGDAASTMVVPGGLLVPISPVSVQVEVVRVI
jgi:hypothetical protein